MTTKAKTSGVKTPTKPWGLYIILFILFWIIIISYLGIDNFIQSKGREVETIKVELATIKAENDKLLLTKGVLSAPQRIEDVAINTLGMIYPTDDSRVFYITNTNDDKNDEAPQSK